LDWRGSGGCPALFVWTARSSRPPEPHVLTVLPGFSEDSAAA